MSFITNFNFRAYASDLRARETLQNKNSFSVSLLSCDDMERMSAVDVTARLNDKDVNRSTPWAPKTVKKYPGVQWPTFYDTRMGNFDCRPFPTQRCSTCTSDDSSSRFGNERCAGHFGTIRMPRMYPSDPTKDKERIVVYNPHLQQELEYLLQAQCFCCHRLRANEFDVQRYRWALLLVDFGLIGDALHLLDTVPNSRAAEQHGKRPREPHERLINDSATLELHCRTVLAKHSVTDADIREAITNRSGSKLKRNLSGQDVRNDIVSRALKEFRQAPNDCAHCHSFSPRVTTKDQQFFFHFGKKGYIEFNIQNGKINQSDVTQWERENKRNNRTRTYFAMNFALEHVKALCRNEAPILGLLFPSLGEASIELKRQHRLPTEELWKVFFLDRLLVAPNPLRLNSGTRVNDGRLESDGKTKLLDNALGFVEQIETYWGIIRAGKVPTDAQEIANEINMRNLQMTVNESFTSVVESFAKKEGLFRMHMMGKRVNQACRSVISPDFLVEPNEVLLPRPFARNLSYPEQITFHSPARLAFLKRCIANGPHKYPGATHIEHRLSNGEVKMIDLRNLEPGLRRTTAERICAQALQFDEFVVYRHVVDGDRCVFNRQPTLHKPSMMGYRVRVLSGLKTIRFHYVNGKSYNADFDGDEMNVHIPQTIEAKAELDVLMDANLNFLVATSGKPIRGLIQDHVAAGVLLTTRDKFMDHPTFIQFLYYGLFPYLTSCGVIADFSSMVPPPAVLKPRALWTGKQLLSVLIRFVSGAYSAAANNGPSLKGTSLIQPNAFNHTDLRSGKSVFFKKDELSDERVIFRNGELLSGMICKNQLGPSNMSVAHVIHELYGAHAVGELFGALGRVLTMTLQREGFSMGADDMALTNEKRRTDLLRQLDEAPLLLPDNEAAAMGKIMELSTALQKEYTPGRMLVPFPKNQLLMMTVSGAKGSNTNTIQMSLVLGQQLFDGQRVKRMNSGKTLPGFFVGEKRARSFGYAMGRFASGIRPPEYTIHAMAGREGLIDTAVKTSRSGHLQRCLIKGLESLTISWDRSVRDSNGSVVQFTYGGDGLDPCKSSTLTAWEMSKENLPDLQKKFFCLESEGRLSEAGSPGGVVGGKRAHEDDDDERGAIAKQRIEGLRASVEAEAQRDPLPQPMKASLRKFIDTKADVRTFTRVAHVQRWVKQGNVATKLREKKVENCEYFYDLIGELATKRRLRAYCEAGEPVGLLAAQAAGEPSTQMTLNTFHSAGSTVTHVTEGIPRLRELLIHASVSKPAVVIPIEKAGPEDEAALEKILKVAVPVKLMDCLAPMAYHRNIKLNVVRGEGAAEITMYMIFSEDLLKATADAMCMTTQEHVGAFTSALKSYVRIVVNELRGRSGSSAKAADGGEENATRDAVEDPEMLHDDDKDSDDAVSEDDEQQSLDGAEQEPKSPEMHPDDGILDERLSDVGGDSDVAVQDKGDDNEEQEVEGTVPEPGLKQKPGVRHSGFAPISCTYGAGKFHATICSMTRKTCPHLASLPKGLFVVKVRLVTPTSIVTVIPDVVHHALTNVTFPTWLPQFEAANFARSSDDLRSGELWFQGKGATVKQAVYLISMFALNAPAIKYMKARSSDIHDMANSLGIESAYKSLFDELQKLFKRYSVDARHMSLVSDAATHRGIWENYNFTGIIQRSASPLFQMTFASAKRFLHTAVTRGVGDGLQSISAAIMVGEKPKVGTATVKWFNDHTLLQDVYERTHSSK